MDYSRMDCATTGKRDLKGGTLPQEEGEGGNIATKESVLRPYKPTGFRV